MEKTNGEFECDETFVGGRRHRRNDWRKPKTPVFGIVKRGGKVYAKVVKNIQRYSLDPYILGNMTYSAQIMTDEAPVYADLSWRFVHLTVNHSQGEYVRKTVHTNTIEGFWSHLKVLYKCHRFVSPEYLQKYVDNTAFVYNGRLSPIPIFWQLLHRLGESPDSKVQ